MNLQIYDIDFLQPDGALLRRTIAADDRREAMRIARHVAQVRGWRVASKAPSVYVEDPEAGPILFEGDFLRLPGFDRATYGVYAKSKRHAEGLAQRLASEQSLVFCPASIRLSSKRDKFPDGRFLHLLNPPSTSELMDIPASLPPLSVRSAQIGLEHELAVLALLGRMGWASAEQVASGCRIGASASRRVLQRLLDAGEVTRSRPFGRVFAYALTGLAISRLELAGKFSGYSLVDAARLGRTAEHRFAANNVALYAMRRGMEVVFEHEAKVRGVLLHGRDKLPDAFYGPKDPLQPGVWVEVESSTRSVQAWGVLLDFLATVFEPGTTAKLKNGRFVGFVQFVCRDPAAFRAALELRLGYLTKKPDARAHLWKQLQFTDKYSAWPVRRLEPSEPAHILSRCDFEAMSDYMKPQ